LSTSGRKVLPSGGVAPVACSTLFWPIPGALKVQYSTFVRDGALDPGFGPYTF